MSRSIALVVIFFCLFGLTLIGCELSHHQNDLGANGAKSLQVILALLIFGMSLILGYGIFGCLAYLTDRPQCDIQQVDYPIYPSCLRRSGDFTTRTH
jgi:hypothetical protein